MKYSNLLPIFYVALATWHGRFLIFPESLPTPHRHGLWIYYHLVYQRNKNTSRNICNSSTEHISHSKMSSARWQQTTTHILNSWLHKSENMSVIMSGKNIFVFPWDSEQNKLLVQWTWTAHRHSIPLIGCVQRLLPRSAKDHGQHFIYFKLPVTPVPPNIYQYICW